MMRAFFGGQILDGCRGDLAAVINRQDPKQEVGQEYNVFVYPTTSEEFVNLTGVRDVTNPLERVYIGVSKAVGDKIALLVNGKRTGAVNLKDIDELVITPHFLAKYLAKPKRVVLESTSDGYAVSEVTL